MKLIRSTKSKTTKDKNGENYPHLEINEVVLVHCNVFNNNYKHNLIVLYTFIPNKSLCQILDISPKIFVFLKTFNLEFSYTEV